MSASHENIDVHVDEPKQDEQFKENAEGHVLETKYASLTRRETIKQFWKCMIFCGIATWAALNDGFQQQLPGNVVPLSGFVKIMADTTVDGVPTISAKVLSYWGGFGSVSQTIAQFVGGYMSDYIGRKKTMYVFTLLFFVSATLEITAQNWKMWLGSKIVVTFAIGIAQSVLIIYVSEIAPFQLRGALIATYQLFLGVGQLVGSIATQILVATTPDKFRPLIASEYVFTGIFCLMLPFLPESHLYHARKGEEEQAKKCMTRLYGTAQDYDVDHEYRVIKAGLEEEERATKALGSSSYTELFRGPNLRRTAAGALGICAQPLSGGPIVFSYSTYFFSVAGLENPFLVTVIVFLTLIIFICIAMYICERVGRRPLLLGGCTAMLLFNVGLGATGSFTNKAAGKAALGMLILWVMAYAMSTAPVGFISAGETSTPRLRAKTTAFNFASYSATYLIFTWTVPYMISPTAANLGVKAAYIFAGFLVPTIIAIYLLYPEVLAFLVKYETAADQQTTGRTYLELDELYSRGVPAWKFKTAMTNAEAEGLKATELISHKV